MIQVRNRHMFLLSVKWFFSHDIFLSAWFTCVVNRPISEDEDPSEIVDFWGKSKVLYVLKQLLQTSFIIHLSLSLSLSLHSFIGQYEVLSPAEFSQWSNFELNWRRSLLLVSATAHFITDHSSNTDFHVCSFLTHTISCTCNEFHICATQPSHSGIKALTLI